MPDAPPPDPIYPLDFAVEHLREALRHATIARATLSGYPFMGAYVAQSVDFLQQAVARLEYLVGPAEPT